MVNFRSYKLIFHLLNGIYHFKAVVFLIIFTKIWRNDHFLSMKELTNEEKELILKLGKRIKQLRIQGGHSNYEHFANENGISRTQYGRYEVGDNIKFLTLFKILKGLDLTFADFFKEGFESKI